MKNRIFSLSLLISIFMLASCGSTESCRPRAAVVQNQKDIKTLTPDVNVVRVEEIATNN